MLYLIIGLALFCGVHLIFPALSTLRTAMIQRLGENGYKGVFTVLVVAGMVLIVIGYRQTEIDPVYTSPTWGRMLNVVLMAVSLILFAAANMPGNIKRVTRHPMLWGLVLWSLAHLAVKGHLAAMTLFGSMAGFAMLAMISANARGAKKQAHAMPVSKDVITIVAGLIAFVIIRLIHPNL